MLDNLMSKQTAAGVFAALAILGFIRWQTGKNAGV